LKVQKCK